jgi:transposase
MLTDLRVEKTQKIMVYRLQSKRTRYFSEEVRREVVKKIESHQLSIAQASREYEVSPTSIYKWMYRYSLYLKKGIRVVMEKKSRANQIQSLQDRISELERAVGQKQMEIDILNKTLEFGSEEAGFDIKKKFDGKSYSGTKTKQKHIHTKGK